MPTDSPTPLPTNAPVATKAPVYTSTPEPTNTATPSKEPAGVEQPLKIINNCLIGKDNWIYFWGNNAESYYRGTNILDTAAKTNCKTIFEKLNDVCKTKGITLVIATIPNKEQVYPEHMPQMNIINTTKRQEDLLGYLQKNSTVKYLYPLKELIDAKSICDLYHMQDSHWNTAGGFMGAMEIYKAAGLAHQKLSDMNITIKEKSGGDLSALTGLTSNYMAPDIDYLKTVTPVSNYFANHVSSDKSELAVFESSEGNFPDKKIAVIGDSYRHAMKNYISKDFGKSLLAHADELKFRTPVVVDYIKELSKGDIIVLMAVERRDVYLCNYAQMLTNILME
jgi:hypothetical protein